MEFWIKGYVQQILLHSLAASVLWFKVALKWKLGRVSFSIQSSQLETLFQPVSELTNLIKVV
jgi:hypothetical protein